MQATAFEYKWRYWLHGVAYCLGFFAPWDTLFEAKRTTLWVGVSSGLAHLGLLTFERNIWLLLSLAILFTGLGAALRVWGAAYVGASIVQSGAMHGQRMLADGPYRHTRNPLYLGTLLHTIGIALLMPVSGAVVAVALLWLFQIRLALAEEPFLTERFGQAYIDYRNTVPRFLPSPSALVPSAGQHPHWLQGVLGELYFVGVFLTLAVFGWQFNQDPLLRGILISLGVSMIAKALTPAAKSATT